MEFRLASQHTAEKDFMNEGEFTKAMDQFFFVADEKHSIISYRTAQAHAVWDNYDVVPLTKLAQIAAYFSLIQLMNDMTESISTIVTETRAQIKAKEVAEGLGKRFHSHPLKSIFFLIR